MPDSRTTSVPSPGSSSAAAPALRVLVVDDERLSRETTARQLRAAGYEAQACADGATAEAALEGGPWDVVLCDIRMPGMDGIELLRRTRRRHPDVDVLLMTAYGTVESAVEAMREGAADYLTKPFHFRELAHRLEKLRELRGARRQVENLRALVGLDDGGEASLGIVGADPAVALVRRRIQAFAGHDAPVLITGETGTGKEVVARALHEAGPRAGGPFVAVGCGAIPESLAESELFGHERGAFTGATARRKGAFERAHRGTLLLDDVDDLPLPLQAALLRVLQEGTFTRVGGAVEQRVDVRVVATTKVDLAALARAGRFRDDLYYRLRGLELRLPPLRERGEDVLLLARHFLRLRDVRCGLTPGVAKILRRYPWPGNVRELRHAIDAAIVLCDGDGIREEFLPDFLLRSGAAERGAASEVVELHLDGVERVALTELVEGVERQLFQWALVKAEGSQTRAAALLGLARTTFQSRLDRLQRR